MFNWKHYEEKLLAIRSYLEGSAFYSPDIEVKLFLPGSEDFELEKEIPHLKVHFYIDQQRNRTRIIELFEYYLEKDLTELIKILKDMIEEFVAESESTEYGGG
ncbi:dephospho-CoA kinase [Thermocrinis sp.]